MPSSTTSGIPGLPPDDRERSPHTGWCRAHWEALADHLLNGVRPDASRNHALVFFPGGRRKRTNGLEGYARTFLLAAFRLAGSQGRSGDLADRYAAGLRAGSDPKSREAWPDIQHTSQPMVEAAFIALGLHESRPWIWDRLTDADRSRLIAWLSGVRGKRAWPNNWLLFPVIVNAFLKSVDAPHDQTGIDRNLDLIDACYRRDGWYTDGPGANYDYYVGWGIHFWTLMWCRLDGDRSAPERAAEYRERARRYLAQVRLLFAANGAPLYQGRSLTYRFAVVAPFWAGALTEATPLSAGETRRLASGALRHFVERGAIRNGLLTRGWYGEFPSMLQRYSGHGSQYWASKAFLGLVLPAEHPVWTAVEEPLPVEREDFTKAMQEPGFLVTGTRDDGIVRIASHRSDHYPLPVPRSTPVGRVAVRLIEVVQHGLSRPALAPDDPHYRKLAYSTHTAPDMGARGDERDVDSQIALLRPGDKRSRRVRIHPIAIVDRFGASVFYPDEPIWSPRVETVSIAWGAAEIRIHHVTSAEPVAVRDGGFAVADQCPPETTAGPLWSSVWSREGLTSLICGLHGFESSGVQELSDTNPFGSRSAVPYLVAQHARSTEAIYISLVLLSGRRVDPAEVVRHIETVDVKGRAVSISSRSGECFFVQMVAPETIDRRLGTTRLRGPVRFARVTPDGALFSFCG